MCSYLRRPRTTLIEARRETRRLHDSPRSEEAYVDRTRAFIRFHNRRPPREVGGPEVSAFLSHLAVAKRASASTQNQALCALVLLYRKVLSLEAPCLHGLERARGPDHLPVVLPRDEVRAVLAQLVERFLLIAELLSGSGLRSMESISLRVKDIDLDRHQVVGRRGKGPHDRVTVLPARIRRSPLAQLDEVARRHQRERRSGRGQVDLPPACRTRPWPRRHHRLRGYGAAREVSTRMAARPQAVAAPPTSARSHRSAAFARLIGQLFINLFLFGAEVFRQYCSDTEHLLHPQYAFTGLHGRHARVPHIWLELFLSVASFLLFLIRARRGNVYTRTVNALMIYGRVYIEKGIALVIPGFTPSVLGDSYEYSPRRTGLMVSVGIYGVGLLLYSLMVKVAESILRGELNVQPGTPAVALAAAAPPSPTVPHLGRAQ